MKYLKHLFASALAFIIIELPFQAFGAEEADEGEKGEQKSSKQISISIPPLALGHEEAYRRFLNGVLAYRPNEGSKEGQIKLHIRDLKNPLKGTFDISSCGDVGQYLSISTGYRKKVKEENKDKLEIWLTPRFLVKKEIQGEARHLQRIFPDKWPEKAPFGIFWNMGNKPIGTYDYSMTDNFEEVVQGVVAKFLNKFLTTRVLQLNEAGSVKGIDSNKLLSLKVAVAYLPNTAEWELNIIVDQAELPGTFVIYAFLGEPPLDRTQWDDAVTKVATLTLLGTPGEKKPNKQLEGMTIPLTPLLEKLYKSPPYDNNLRKFTCSFPALQ